MICAKKNVTPTVKLISSRATIRSLSTKELTQRQKEDAEALLRVERFRKYQQKSSKFISPPFHVIASISFDLDLSFSYGDCRMLKLTYLTFVLSVIKNSVLYVLYLTRIALCKVDV